MINGLSRRQQRFESAWGRQKKLNAESLLLQGSQRFFFFRPYILFKASFPAAQAAGNGAFFVSLLCSSSAFLTIRFPFLPQISEKDRIWIAQRRFFSRGIVMHRMITELDAAWLRLVGLLAGQRAGGSGGKEHLAVVCALFELEDKRRQVGLPALDQLGSRPEQIRWN